DDFGQVRSGVTDTIIDGQFHRADLRYDHPLHHGTLPVAPTLGCGQANNDGGSVRDLTLGARATLEERLSPTMVLRAGGDVTLDRYDLLGSSATSPSQQTLTDLLYPAHLDAAVGGYADVV